jgi:P27 family predicted phage terminase small subunit
MSSTSKGPRPKPTQIRRIQGNPGRRPLNKREPKPETPVKRPWGLGRGLAGKFWNEHAPELERLNVLTGVDGPAFRLMAEHYALAVEAVKELKEQGMTIEGREGLRKNPLAQLARDNSMAFKAYAVEFGMTPSSRTRLQLPEDAEQLTLADALFAAVSEAMGQEGDHRDGEH